MVLYNLQAGNWQGNCLISFPLLAKPMPPEAVFIVVFSLCVTHIFKNAKNGLKTASKALNVKYGFGEEGGSMARYELHSGVFV